MSSKKITKKQMKTHIELNVEGFNELYGSDLESWMLVQRAYANYSPMESIMGAGMNLNTGYVYIALDNGIQIASCFGQDVEYIVTDSEDGEEFFYESYQEADVKLYELYK